MPAPVLCMSLPPPGRLAYPTQTWRLGRNAHASADPAGFDWESRLLCAFLVWYCEPTQPRSKKDKAARPALAFKITEDL